MAETSPSTVWHENDRFWELLEPFIFSEGRMAIAGEEVQAILELASPPARGAILDLGCGLGRHSIELARRGFRVTAIDRTSNYLEKARNQAAKNALSIEFLCQDCRDFSRPEAFDGVLSLFTSFGYFQNDEDESRVLKNIFDSLKPGGFVLIDVFSREVLKRMFQPQEWSEANGTILLQGAEITADFRSVESTYIFLRGGERWDYRVPLRVYGSSDLSSKLQSVGFEAANVYGSLQGSPYVDWSARRLVVVARKPRIA